MPAPQRRLTTYIIHPDQFIIIATMIITSKIMHFPTLTTSLTTAII